MKKLYYTLLTAMLLALLPIAATAIFISCEVDRLSPEFPLVNQPPSPALPLMLNGFVKDASNQVAISGAIVKIVKTDGVLLTTLVSDNNGMYSYNASSITDNTLFVSASKDNYAFATRIISIYPASNSAIVSDILLTKLQIVTSPVTVSAGGSASTINAQSLANQFLAIQILANSVSSNFQVALSSIQAGQLPQPTNQNGYILSAGQFGPSGTQFSKPITITFPLPFKQTPNLVYPLWQLNEQTGVYTNSGFSAVVNSEGTSASSSQVTHFSTYVLQTTQTNEVTVTFNAPSTSVANEFFERLPSGTLNKPLTIINSVSLSGNGQSNDLWLKDVIASKLKFSIGNTEQTLTFSYKQLPSIYIKNGLQVGPPGHDMEKGNWEFRTHYALESTTITGNAFGPNWERTITATSQIWKIIHEGWYWIQHDQGGIFFGPY